MSGSTPEYELLRYDMSIPDPDKRPVEVLAVHPPIPVAALPALREELQGLSWWHRSADTWAAVMALHRADQHATAVELAQFLNWCDDGGPRADAAIFEIRPVAVVVEKGEQDG